MPTVFPRSGEIASRYAELSALWWPEQPPTRQSACQRTRRSQPYLSSARPYWMSCSR